MQRTLINFLRESAERPFAWGMDDCSLWLADWWRLVHGNDPAAELRGTYDSREGKDAVLAKHRNLQRLVTRLATQCGAARTPDPTTGDFGLIAIDGKPYGAICSGGAGDALFWVVRGERGVTFVTNPRFLRAWSIHVGQHLAPSRQPTT